MKSFGTQFICLLIAVLAVCEEGVCAEPPSSLPKIYLKKIESSGKDRAPEPSYEVQYYENILAIECAVTSPYDSIKSYKFRAISESINGLIYDPWLEEKTPYKKYTDLKPGKYVFEIKYVTTSGRDSNTIRFNYRIERPWWRTWWFWGACFISLFGLFYGRERFLKFWADEEQRHHRQIVELELRTLQLQMNPHFVFNALNSIQSYVMTHDALTANNYLSKFAHLIRLFLDSSRSKFISLSEEARMLTLYSEMEKLRFDNKFDFELIIDPEVNKYIEIPTMILQPFVENSINHGLRYKREKGFLHIRFYYEGQYLICKIEDNGVGRRNADQIQSKSRKGYNSQGLKITAERLITYNKINETNIVFSISDKNAEPHDTNEEVGTVVEVKFPKN